MVGIGGGVTQCYNESGDSDRRKGGRSKKKIGRLKCVVLV